MTDFKAKCIKFDFSWGSASDPAGGAYSAPPDPRAGIGTASRQGEGLGWDGEGKGREGEVEGGKGRAPKVTVEPGAVLRKRIN